MIIALADGGEGTIADQTEAVASTKTRWTVELELCQATTIPMRHVLKDGSQSEW